MALVSVNSPHPGRPKESTFDKVLKGLEVANQILGIGVTAYGAYEKGQANDIEREKLQADIGRLYTPSEDGAPGATKIGSNYYQLRKEGLDFKTIQGAVKDGLVKLVPSDKIPEYQKNNKPVTELSIPSGIPGRNMTFYAVPGDGLDEKYQAELAKMKAETSKITAEAAEISSGRGKEIDSIKELADYRRQSHIQQRAGIAKGVLTQLDQISDKSSGLGASDIALMTLFSKASDPTSVVREGEFDRAKLVGGLGDKGGAIYNSLINGKQLTEPQRQDIINVSKKLAGSHLYLGYLEDRGIADEAITRGLDPRRVIREYDPKELPRLIKKYSGISSDDKDKDFFNVIPQNFSR